MAIILHTFRVQVVAKAMAMELSADIRRQKNRELLRARSDRAKVARLLMQEQLSWAQERISRLEQECSRLLAHPRPSTLTYRP